MHARQQKAFEQPTRVSSEEHAILPAKATMETYRAVSLKIFESTTREPAGSTRSRRSPPAIIRQCVTLPGSCPAQQLCRSQQQQQQGAAAPHESGPDQNWETDRDDLSRQFPPLTNAHAKPFCSRASMCYQREATLRSSVACSLSSFWPVCSRLLLSAGLTLDCQSTSIRLQSGRQLALVLRTWTDSSFSTREHKDCGGIMQAGEAKALHTTKRSSGVDVSDPALAEAWASVRRDAEPQIDWCAFTTAKDSKNVFTMLGSGSGGVRELAGLLRPDMVVFCGLRASGGGATRFHRVMFVGDDVGGMQRGRAALQKNAVFAVFEGASAGDHEFTSVAELSSAAVFT